MTFGGTMRGATGGGGVGAGGSSAFQFYRLADIVDSDQKTLVSGTPAATGDDDEGIEFVAEDGVAATTVGAMSFWEWDLVDWLGEELDSVTAADLVRVLVQHLDAILPLGLRIGVALTDLGMGNSPQAGFAVGIQHHAANSSYYAWFSTLVAGTWAAVSTATQPDPLTRGVEGVVVRDTVAGRLRVGAIPYDATGLQLPRTTTSNLNGTTAAADGTYTRIALLVGTSANLAAPATVRAAIKSLLARVQEIPRILRKAPPTVVPRFPSDGAFHLGVAGDSYAVAFNAGSALSGQATSTGLAETWAIRFAGATITTWPTSTVGAPNVGMVGYLLPLFEAWSGNTGGVVIRRGTSGDAIGDLTEEYDPDLGGILNADCVALGTNRLDAFVLFCGTNDASSAGDTARFPDRLRRYIEMVRDHSPHCVIYVPVTTPDVGTFPHIATVEAAKATVCAEYEHVYHIDCAYDSGDTSGHPTDAGHEDIAIAIDAHLQGLAA